MPNNDKPVILDHAELEILRSSGYVSREDIDRLISSNCAAIEQIREMQIELNIEFGKREKLEVELRKANEEISDRSLSRYEPGQEYSA